MHCAIALWSIHIMRTNAASCTTVVKPRDRCEEVCPTYLVICNVYLWSSLMKVSSMFVYATAILMASASLTSQAASVSVSDDIKAQSCFNAFVDQYLPGRTTVAKLDSDNPSRSLTSSTRFEMAMTAATRDGHVIAAAVCKVEQGVTSITSSNKFLIAAN
jgi:hypothetical protein